MKTMRVLLLSHFPGRGGSNSLLRQLRDALESRGAACSVLVGRDDPNPILADYQVVDGRTPAERRRSYLEKLLAGRPDVVFRLSGVEELDWLRFTPCARVSHCFSFESHEYLSIPHLVRQAAGVVDLWTANTPDLEPLLGAAAGKPVAFELLPYRLPEPFLAGPPPAFSDRPSLRIAYVGRLDSLQKQIERLPAIMRRVRRHTPAARWDIFGDGPDRARLLAALEAHGVRQLATLHSWTSAAELAAALRSCDLFFLCSRWEGLPTALVEAMLCGLAPVVPRLPGGIRHVVTPGVGWAYQPNTAAQAARALVAAAANRPVLDEHRARSFQLARRLADPAFVEKQLDTLFDRLKELRCHGPTETDLHLPALAPLPFRDLPAALARRAWRKLTRPLLHAP